jgi:uncharacterized membrane protein YphA (DoxX/SURF4 family)
MKRMLKHLSGDKIRAYFILIARVLLAWTFIRYGYGKLSEGQFGISEAEMATPLKDLSLFKLSWYLFDHEPFNSFTGISQIICGTLLLINRTTLIGAFLFLPMVTTILIIDLSFMPPALAGAFAWRLSFYMVLDLLILWHYKDRMRVIWNALWERVSTSYKFPIWTYMLVPVFAIGLEIAGFIPKIVIQFIVQPVEIWQSLLTIPQIITEVLKKIGG